MTNPRLNTFVRVTNKHYFVKLTSMRKKRLLLLLFSIFFCVLIGILFYKLSPLTAVQSRSIQRIQISEADDGKTIPVHVGSIVTVKLSRIDSIDLSNKTVLEAISGLSGPVGSAAYGFAYGFTGKGEPTFRVASQGIVDITAPVQCPGWDGCAFSIRVYHFRVVATL